MAYTPEFSISARLLSFVEAVAALRERIQGAAVELSWIPALQKDTRTRNVHASTAIEGNPLTLEQVRALEEGRELAASDPRSQREVMNYFAGLRYIEKNARKKTIRHEDVLGLHRILAKGVMDQGEAGRYRSIAVRVGRYVPPAPDDVSGLMFELLEWWNRHSGEISPVLSSAVLHYRLPMATGAPDAPLRFGNSTAAASTPITFSPWMNITGRIAPATTPRWKQCGAKMKTSPAGWNTAPTVCGKHWSGCGCASRRSISSRRKNSCCARNRSGC